MAPSSKSPRWPAPRRRGNGSRDGLAVTVTAVTIGLGLLAAYLLFKPAHHANTAAGERPFIAQLSGAGSSSGQQQQSKPGGDEGGTGAQQHKLAVADPEEQRWFSKLSTDGCKETEHLRVCSHRAAIGELDDVASGSLTAYSALFRAHIRCFDIDFVATSDGHLLAAHPADLHKAAGSALWATEGGGSSSSSMIAAVGRATLAQVRAAGASEEAFPTVEPLLQLLAELLVQAQALWPGSGSKAAQQTIQQQQTVQQQGAAGAGAAGGRRRLREGEGGGEQAAAQGPDYASLPVLLMDLKGPAFNPDIIRNVTLTAQAAKVQAHVALYVTSEEQRALARNASWAGPLIAGFMDQQDPSPSLSPEAAPWLSDVAMLGPSVRMADAFFTAALALGKPVLAWVVDGPELLHRALEHKIDRVISNRPLALRRTLGDWRDRCSDRM